MTAAMSAPAMPTQNVDAIAMRERLVDARARSPG